MTDSQRTAGPLSYLVGAKELINRGFGLPSLDEVLRGLTKLFLSDYPSSLEVEGRELKRKIRDNGLWAFTVDYWRNDRFYVKNDTLGIGCESLTENESRLRRPNNPQKVVVLTPSIFGNFTAENFLTSEAASFFGIVSKQLVRVAYKDSLDISVSGLKVKREELVKTVCSVSFNPGYLQINLADKGQRRRYAMGKAPPRGYDKNRFNAA